MIDGLPRNSCYFEAVVQDDDLALAMIRANKGDERHAKRRMREWSAEAELLSTIADRVAELIQATLAARGVKPQPVRPVPRPENALERVRYRERVRRHRSLVARVLPADHHRPGGALPPS